MILPFRGTPAQPAPAVDSNSIPVTFGTVATTPLVVAVAKKPRKRRTGAADMHAAQRALEHYGLTLSLPDIRAIAVACKRGSGRTGRMGDGNREFHTVIHAGRVLSVVYKRTVPGHLDGIVMTILPPAAHEATDRVASYETYRRKHGVTGSRRGKNR